MAWTVRSGSRTQAYGTRRIAEDMTRDMAAWRKRAVMYDAQGQPAFACEKKATEVFCKTLDSGLGGRRRKRRRKTLGACWNVNDTACFERERRRKKRAGLLGSAKKRRRR